MIIHDPVHTYLFHKTHKEAFYDLVKSHSRGVVFASEVEIGRPIKKGITDTEIQISAAAGSSMKGSMLFQYGRLNLNDFFDSIPISILSDVEVIDNEFISNEILTRWNIRLDVECFDIAINDPGRHFPKEVTLTMKEESLVWVGEVTIWILPENHIGTLFDKFELSFNSGTLKHNGYIYSIEKNIVEVPEEVIAILSTDARLYTVDVDTTKVLNFLKEATEDDWVIDQDLSNFNLMNATVIYNGPYDDTNIINHVIVISLTTACGNLFGNLLLKYDIVEP